MNSCLGVLYSHIGVYCMLSTRIIRGISLIYIWKSLGKVCKESISLRRHFNIYLVRIRAEQNTPFYFSALNWCQDPLPSYFFLSLVTGYLILLRCVRVQYLSIIYPEAPEDIWRNRYTRINVAWSTFILPLKNPFANAILEKATRPESLN